jgi:hypothetical protein
VCSLLTSCRTPVHITIIKRAIVLLHTRDINRKHATRGVGLHKHVLRSSYWWCGFKQSYTLFRSPLWYSGFPGSGCDICWLLCCLQFWYEAATDANESTRMCFCRDEIVVHFWRHERIESCSFATGREFPQLFDLLHILIYACTGKSHWSRVSHCLVWSMLSVKQNKTYSVALSPRANYMDWATATCRRNLVSTFVDRGVSRGQRGGSRTVVNLSFLNRSRYFSFK